MSSSVDSKLRFAIAQRRLVRFTSDGLPRIAEPHDYGVFKGVARLFYYQVGGQSRSGTLPGWRWAQAAEIADLVITDESFPGSRPVTGRHVKWDKLFASVSKRG